MKYKHKPTEIDAIQVNWKNWDSGELPAFLGYDNLTKHGRLELSKGANDACGEDERCFIVLQLPNSHPSQKPALHGDWIIKEGVEPCAYFHAMAPEQFTAFYESAT